MWVAGLRDMRIESRRPTGGGSPSHGAKRALGRPSLIERAASPGHVKKPFRNVLGHAGGSMRGAASGSEFHGVRDDRERKKRRGVGK